MYPIDVYFYVDDENCYSMHTIGADDYHDFMEKLEDVMELMAQRAAKQGIELGGIKYNLPKEWRKLR